MPLSLNTYRAKFGLLMQKMHCFMMPDTMFSSIKLDVLKQKRVCFARKMPVETAENTLVGDFEQYVRLVEKPFLEFIARISN